MHSSAQYSRLDRALHSLAFGSPIFQDILADLESSLFSKQWNDIQVKKPVYITSLPRAGTTIILEALHRLPVVATHTYRDMPFIPTPVLWAKAARKFHSHSGPAQERAHGDGLVVNEDSPEAFEEVLWLKYFGDKYSEHSISLWNSNDRSSEFRKYFHDHMKKIILLRRPENLQNARYVSKNNANIARIEVLQAMNPDACIVIPFRAPFEHAISLLRQHKNFCEQHVAEPFVLKYMRDIGHFEFGELHRPIQFPGLDKLIKGLSPASINYWVAYWIVAFEHLIKQRDIAFFSYESFCQSGTSGLNKLCKYLSLNVTENEISEVAGIFRPAPPKRVHEYAIDSDLFKKAMGLHEQLLNQCLLSK